MKKRIPHLVIFVGLIVLALVQIGYYFSILPDQVAASFDAAGQPEETRSKLFWVAMYLGILLVGAAYFITALILLHKLPDRYLKILPYHEYWLAEERRRETVARLTGKLLWLGIATMLLFMATFQLIFMTNVSENKQLMEQVSPFLTTIYLTFVFIGVIRFRLDFQKVPPEVSGPKS
jgi:hypothetical protein